MNQMTQETPKDNRVNAVREGYKFFRSDSRYEDCLTGINCNVYSQLCGKILKKLATKLVEGKQVDLPFIGRLGVQKRQMSYEQKNLVIDFNHYNKTGERVYHFNEHSDGYIAKLFHKKDQESGLGHFRFVRFFTARRIKRRIAAQMKKKDGHKIYPVK